MIFVTLMKRKEGAGNTRRATMTRRVDWQYPEGYKVLGEYWLAADDPSVVAIVEGDDIGPLYRTLVDWDDAFEFHVYPAMPAEVGIALTRQALASATA